MPSFSQLHLTLKKAACLYYESDYLNHGQEIIIQFLAENKAIFIREDSQIDFATGNVFLTFLNFPANHFCKDLQNTIFGNSLYETPEIPAQDQQLKMPYKADTKFHFRHPRADTIPHFDSPRADK